MADADPRDAYEANARAPQPSRGPALAEPRAPQTDFQGFGEAPNNLPIPYVPDGATMVTTKDSVITAQRVAVKRDMAAVMRNLAISAAMAGDGYVYSWPVKDRTNNRTVTIEGKTIKLANDVARIYGNCIVDVRAFEEQRSWVFYARFVDLETGFQMTRAFQQRKGQNTGMRDQDRALDLIFQIGQSKAIRNVVVNALSTLCDYAMEEAKKNLLGYVEKDPDKARAFILKVVEEYDIGLERIERVIGRTFQKWTVRDMARVLKELRAVDEQMVDADELYPRDGGAAGPAAPETGSQGEGQGGPSAAGPDKSPAPPAQPGDAAAGAPPEPSPPAPAATQPESPPAGVPKSAPPAPAPAAVAAAEPAAAAAGPVEEKRGRGRPPKAAAAPQAAKPAPAAPAPAAPPAPKPQAAPAAPAPRPEPAPTPPAAAPAADDDDELAFD